MLIGDVARRTHAGAGDDGWLPLTPQMFGAAADGSADCATAFNSMITEAAANKRRCFLPPGTYRIDSTVTLLAGTYLEGAPGSLIDFSNALTSDILFEAAGVSTSTSTLSTNATAGASTLTVTSGTPFAVGQLVQLESTKVWDTVVSATYSEMHRIKAKSGTTITPADPTLYAYATADTATLRVLATLYGITLVGIRAVGGGTGKNHKAVSLTVCERFLIDRCDFDLFANRGIELVRCADGTVRDTRVTRCDAVGLAYGVAIVTGSHWITVRGCHFEDLRHGVTVGGTSGICRGITVADNHVYGSTDAGLDCHPAGDQVVFSGNTIVCGSSTNEGIVVQGKSCIVSDNIIRGVQRHGIFAQLCPASLPAWPVTIADNIIGTPGASPDTAIYMQNIGAAAAKRVSITGNSIATGWTTGIDVSAEDTNGTGAVEFIVIANNVADILSSRGIRIRNDAGVTIDFASITGNVMRIDAAGDECIQLAAAGANEIEHVTITGNTTFDGSYGVRSVDADKVTVVGNTFISAATADVSITGASTWLDWPNVGSLSRSTPKPQVVVLGTVFDPASATLQDVTGMSFAVKSGRRYRFLWLLHYRSTSLTVGPQFSLTFPTANMQAVLRAQAATSSTVTLGLGFYESSFGTSGAAQIIPDVPATGTSMKCIIEGWIWPSADGTLQLQFANESGSTNCTLRDGSTGTLWDEGT